MSRGSRSASTAAPAAQPAVTALPRASASGRAGLLGLALIFVLALVPRLIAMAQYEAHHPQAAHPAIDEASYDDWAREIAAGDWLGSEVFFQEPLYPYALGAVYRVLGPDRTRARIVQSLLGALTCVLAVLVGRRALGPAPGWIAGVLLALHAPAILMPSLLLKPNLVLPVLLALVLALPTGEGRPRRWLLFGALAGLGALLRGNVLVLLPLLVLWPVGRALGARAAFAPARRRSLAVAAGVALVLLPVALRNQHVGGVFALSTSGAGTNLYGGNNPHNPYGVATEFPWVRGIPKYEASDWKHEAQRRTGRELGPGQVSAYWTREVLRSAREQPTLHLTILWNKLRATLGAYEVPDNHALEWDARYVSSLRLPWPGFGLSGMLGLAGLLVFLLRRLQPAALRLSPPSSAAWELALLFTLYLGTIVLTVTSSRVRLALVPLLLPFAGLWGMVFLAALRSSKDAAGRARALLLPTAALAVAALWVHVPVFDAATRADDLADRDHNLAVHLLEQDRVSEAALIAAELEHRYPHTARIQTLNADVEWRTGWRLLSDPDPARAEEGRLLVAGALSRLREAAARPGVFPRERSRALSLAGWIQLALGNHAAAERHLRGAREFAPGDPDLILAHAQALIGLVESGLTEHAREAHDLLDILARLPGHEEALAELRARLPRSGE